MQVNTSRRQSGKLSHTDFVLQASQQVYECDNSGFKRPSMEMIETRKQSVFEGPVCSKDYHVAPISSQYCIASELYFFSKH